MAVNRVQLLDNINEWRQKAYALSRSDQLGRLLCKTLDLMESVAVNGVASDSVPIDVESLTRELRTTKTRDCNRDCPLRSTLYGICSSLISMLQIKMAQAARKAAAKDQRSKVAGRKSVTFNDQVETRYIEGRARADEHVVVKQIATYGFSDQLASVVHDYKQLERAVYKPVTFGFSLLKKAEPVVSETIAVRLAIKDEPMDESWAAPPQDDSMVAESAAMDVSQADSSQDTLDLTLNQSGRRRRSSVYYGDDEEDVKPVIARTFACSTCDMKFINARALSSHSIVHKGIRCGECSAHLNNQSNLEAHYADKHPGKEVRSNKDTEDDLHWASECPECGAKMANRATYKAHMRSHNGDKPYGCRKCQGSYRTSAILKAHMRNTHGENPFACVQCDRTFKRQRDMFAHKKEAHKKN